MDLCGKKLVNQLDVSKRLTKPVFARTDTPTRMDQDAWSVNCVQPAIFVLGVHNNRVRCTHIRTPLGRPAVKHAQALPTNMGFTRRAGWKNS